MGFRIEPTHPEHPDHSHPVGYAKSMEKGVSQLSNLLTSLLDLEQMSDIPPAVQQVLDLRAQLTTLLDSNELTGMRGIIPALHKTMASLQPIVHQLQEELRKNDTVDFTKGPFASAWTNVLLDRAKTEMTELIELLS